MGKSGPRLLVSSKRLPASRRIGSSGHVSTSDSALPSTHITTVMWRLPLTLSASRKLRKNITAETPNVLAIYLLKRAIQKYLSSGLETIRTETLTRAKRFYEQLNYTPFRALVTSKEFQSPTVFAVVSDADISTWRANLTSQQQMYTGACYSELKPHAFRIANFPIHTEEEHSAILNQMKLFTA